MNESERARGEHRFWTLAEPLLQQAGVTRSTMMGFACLRLNGDFFASCDHRTGNLVVKLDEHAVSVLIQAGKAEPFAPNGRRFREWASIPVRQQRSWSPLLDEALQTAVTRTLRVRRPTKLSSPGELARTERRELKRVRRIALALPEVSEQTSHGAPCFFIRDTRALCYFHDHHGGDDRISLWCPAPVAIADELVHAEPERFFKPPTSAKGTFSGWIGVYLDTTGKNKVDWDEIAAILEDAYRTVAPKRLVAGLDDI